MEVAGAADIGVQQGLAVRGRRRAWSVEAVAEDRGDGIVGQHPDLDGAQADRLGPVSGQAAEQAQNADAGPEALFRVRAARQNGQDQRLGVWPEVARLTGKPFRAPFGVAPVCARHVVRVGAMTRAAVTPRMSRNPSAVVEHLDGACSGAGIDLFADQRVRHRVIEARDLNMIVDADAGQPPFGILVVLLREILHRRTLNRVI